MKAMIRNSLAVIVGLALGSAVNMLIVIVGPGIIAPLAGVDGSDYESMAASMHLFEPKHFISPFLAHSLGTLAGATAAFLIAVSYRQLFAYAIGVSFLAAGITVVFMLPSPIWFTALDLVVAYLPMAWLGILLGRKIRASGSG